MPKQTERTVTTRILPQRRGLVIQRRDEVTASQERVEPIYIGVIPANPIVRATSGLRPLVPACDDSDSES